MARRRIGWIVWVILVVVAGGIPEAAAHPSPASTALIDFTVDGARIEQDVPVEELELAIHRPLRRDGEALTQMLAREEPFLRAYGREHMEIVGASGEPWSVEVLSVGAREAEDGPYLRFRFSAAAPRGEAAASVRLLDHLVTHEVVSHYTYVHIRSDWARGEGHHQPVLVGAIHGFRRELAIERDGSFWAGFVGVVRSGMEHIASGLDHLMFLLALLLVAPVVARGRRWEARVGWRGSAIVLARLVTAFTLGHSVTLVLGALELLTLPASVVEPLIASSVLVAGAHAVTPIVPRREALVALGFGLIHGLAFAELLPRQELGAAQTAWTLLAFNVGIEAAQLGVVIAVFPWLFVLSRTRAGPGVRIVGGVLASVFASAWIVERVTGVANPLDGALEWVEGHPYHLLVALVVGAIGAWVLAPRTRASAAIGRAPSPCA